MAKAEAATVIAIAIAIAVFVFAMPVALGLDDRTVTPSLRYDPSLGFGAQGPIGEDLGGITDDGTQREINATIAEDRKKAKWCLKQLRQNGLGDKCIDGVTQALLHGHRDAEALNLQCCRIVVAVDKKESDCWDILFAGNPDIEIDTPGLIEFCQLEVLSAGPASSKL